MKTTDSKKLHTLIEASRLTGVPTRHIRQKIDSNELKAFTDSNSGRKIWQIDENDLFSVFPKSSENCEADFSQDEKINDLEFKLQQQIKLVDELREMLSHSEKKLELAEAELEEEKNKNLSSQVTIDHLPTEVTPGKIDLVIAKILALFQEDDLVENRDGSYIDYSYKNFEILHRFIENYTCQYDRHAAKGSIMNTRFNKNKNTANEREEFKYKITDMFVYDYMINGSRQRIEEYSYREFVRNNFGFLMEPELQKEQRR